MIDDLKKILTGQRILIISSKFFGYQERIAERLKYHGAFVSLLDGRPDNSFLTKTIMRYFPFVYRNKINNHYRNLIKNEFDQILIINPEYLSRNIILSLKEKTMASWLILYMWDSFLNKKKIASAIKYFDKVLTFDSDDAERLNVFFRPLFFSSRCQGKKEYHDEIDISFIGTGHSDRVRIIEMIKKQCMDLQLHYYFYLFLPSRFIFYFHKITNKYFKKIKKTYFHYDHIDYEEYIRISESSKMIVDIEHPKQKGLTMRTFEVLGKRRKLITTNGNIKNYDFYNSSNILIIDRLNPIINIDFINTDYQPLPKKIYYKYSIDGWLEDIFTPPKIKEEI
ncbi:MAG: hypothetical protein LBE13_09340 [Bacteroidales bacterium]|jgi:hypothetical protein|nr:hypothetical protein [Bacteroidales bacterium]